MSNREKLTAALLAVFAVDENDKQAAAAALASALVTLQEPLLTELSKQTTLLEVIAKQGERTLDYIDGASDPLCGAAACGLPG